MMRRSLVVGLAFLLGACAVAHSETYPSKTIRVIIPFGAGSATDVIPRIVFDQLSRQLGQAIVVENRGGGGGPIRSTARSKADTGGHPPLVTSSCPTITPPNHANPPYAVPDHLPPL